MSIYASVIADSVSTRGDRLTTMEIQCHRFVLAEFNTHRKLSRNSASSRAIPFPKQLARMEDLGLAYPLSWPKEGAGMQGGEEFDEEVIVHLRHAWEESARRTGEIAQMLHGAGLHKSVINRLLEPFMWHKVIVSSTEWDNFFAQRCSPLAQPEIRAVAEAMREALEASQPDQLSMGQWHLPYIDQETRDEVGIHPPGSNRTLAQISSARCARVSYLTHDGIRSLDKDLELYHGTPERLGLITATPPHWSPMEHPARPAEQGERVKGNFDGWVQLRQLVGG